MTRFSLLLPLLIIAAAAVLPGAAQVPASQPATAPSTRPTTSTADDDVAAWVDGDVISEEVILSLTARPTEEVAPDDPQRTVGERVARARALESAIYQFLLDREVSRAGITLSDAEMEREMRAEMDSYLNYYSMTREELAERLKRERGVNSLEEYIQQRVHDPMLRKIELRDRLIEKRFADKLVVQQEDIEKEYNRYRDRRFTKPERVHVREILIAVAENAAPDEQAAARSRATEVLAKAREPGADFAALARQYSQGPARDAGGDMGWIERFGRAPEPIAEAAFALQPGEISAVIQSPAGFHILQVIERQERRVVPLAEVIEGLKYTLHERKIQREQRLLVTELKKLARIEYPPGKEPVQILPPPAQGSLRQLPPEAVSSRPAGTPESQQVMPPAPQ